MKCPDGYVLLKDNRLVRRFRSKDILTDRFIISHGKRVAADCPVTYEERRAYVQKDAVSAVRLIRARLGCTLKGAVNTLKQATGGDL